MVVFIVQYPDSTDERDVRVPSNATFKDLGRALEEESPDNISRQQLRNEFTVTVARDGKRTALDLTLDQPISISLKNDDFLCYVPGRPPPPASAPGHAVRVINFDDNTIELDEAALASVINVYGIRDLPVAMVSVAGPFRTGKSFMLNFFLRYLENSETWTDRDAEVLEGGFHWKHGVERDTTGIWMWNKPFVCHLPDGRKFAIVLIDTQGTFDRHSTVNENTRIFAINSLISSVQIYNIKEKLQEDMLQQMHLFTSFGENVRQGMADQNDDSKPFQRLTFLVRDWEFPDHPPGAAGGTDYVNKYLDSDAEGLTGELREVREWLRSCYESIDGFLMPDPGKKVKRQDFTGKLSDLEEDFGESVAEFVPFMLSPENIVVKKMAGRELTGADMMLYIKAYASAFNNTALPEVQTMVSAAKRIQRDTLVQRIKTGYEDAMDKVAGPSMPHVATANLQDVHKKQLDSLLAMFDRESIMGISKEERSSLRDEIKQSLADRFSRVLAHNASKDVWKGLQTPFVFAMLAFALNLVGTFLDFIEIDPVAYVLYYAAWASFLLVAAWASLSYSGQYPEVFQQINSLAAVVMEHAKTYLHLAMQHMAKNQAGGAGGARAKTD